MLHTIVYGVLVVGGVCLLARVGFELVQRLVIADPRQRHNDVAGFIYAALGVIYAVLLALVVIAVWEERVVAEGVPGAELVVIPRAGHFSFHERPEAYADAVGRFLSAPVAA